MRRSCVMVLLALLIASLNAPAAAQEHGDAPMAQRPDEELIRSLIEYMGQKIQERDLGPLSGLFPQDDSHQMHIMQGVGKYHRWLVYRNVLRRDLEDFRNLTYSYSGVEVEVRGDVAWAVFVTHLAGDTPIGSLGVRGQGTAILERLEGRWTIVNLHLSAILGARGG